MVALSKSLSRKSRLQLNITLFISIVFSMALLIFRVYETNRITYGFLAWNLFLACIPYAVSTYLVVKEERLFSKWFIVPLVLLWLLFFPNAPYILTDLIHLKARNGVPRWFDLTLLLSFAWNGLMLGYLSLIDIQQVVTRNINKAAGWVVAISSLALCSFGIYLGRFLRWNSWDIITSPRGLFEDILNRLTDPATYPVTYSITILFTVFLSLGYVLLTQLSSQQAEADSPQ